MKHVQEIRRANGKVDLYLRKKGLPSVRLQSPLPAPDEAEDESALAKEVKALIGALTTDKPQPNTLGEALDVYELENADFHALEESTKVLYRGIIKELDETLGFLAIAAFTPAYVLKLRDAWAKRGHRTANLNRQVLKNVLTPSLIAGKLTVNPFELVGQARRPANLGEPHILWPADVVDIVIKAAIAKQLFGLARAVALARYVGARRGDLVKLQPAARDKGRFRFLSGKRKVRVDVPEDPDMAFWLSVIPGSQPDAPRRGRKLPRNVASLPPSTLVFTVTNRRYTPRAVGVALRELVVELHESGAIDSAEYNLHGLRHTRGVELALAGCTDAEGAAMMGHSSVTSFGQYRRQADRIRMSDSGAAKVIELRKSSGVTAAVTEV